MHQGTQAAAGGPAARRDALRAKVFAHYGTECACCGATENLTIDHIDGGGAEHRRELFGRQMSGVHFYAWLAREGFPEGYQTLCHPCNRSKAAGDRCRLDHPYRLEGTALERKAVRLLVSGAVWVQRIDTDSAAYATVQGDTGPHAVSRSRVGVWACDCDAWHHQRPCSHVAAVRLVTTHPAQRTAAR